jgi:predicted esterase
LLVSVQALHRFYTRANEVVASWMTREDREHAIADNVAYVASVVAHVQREHPTDVIVYAGFSQGVAMAYRALAFAHRHADIPAPRGGIVLAGDLPPDVAPAAASLPPVLLGRGAGDTWYTAEKSAADVKALARAGVPVTEHVFQGGHEWDESFIQAAAAFIERLCPGA